MAFDMLLLISDWNVQVPSLTCCSGHAALLHARKALKKLEKGGCVPAPAPDEEPTAMQCIVCGRFDFDMEPGDVPRLRKASMSHIDYVVWHMMTAHQRQRTRSETLKKIRKAGLSPSVYCLKFI